MDDQVSDEPVRETYVWCTTSFTSLHHWPDAPDECGWLRNVHYHRFDVRVEIETTNDRQVEFILLGHKVGGIVADTDSQATLTWSCESWARHIFDRLEAEFGFNVVEVSVSEEGINGATVR